MGYGNFAIELLIQGLINHHFTKVSKLVCRTFLKLWPWQVARSFFVGWVLAFFCCIGQLVAQQPTRNFPICFTRRSGRTEASKPLSPLRTVHDSFPSYGSSISKAKPCGAARLFSLFFLVRVGQKPLKSLSFSEPSFFHSVCDTHLQSFNRFINGGPMNGLPVPEPAAGRTSCSRHLHSHLQRFSKLSRKETPARMCLYSHPPDVSSLSDRVMLPVRIKRNPYPPHYKTAFASSCILCPHLHQCALRFHLPDDFRRRYGVFHVPHYCRLQDDLGLPSTPAVLHLRTGSYETRNLTAYRFGPSLTASLAC